MIDVFRVIRYALSVVFSSQLCVTIAVITNAMKWKDMIHTAKMKNFHRKMYIQTIIRCIYTERTADHQHLPN